MWGLLIHVRPAFKVMNILQSSSYIGPSLGEGTETVNVAHSSPGNDSGQLNITFVKIRLAIRVFNMCRRCESTKPLSDITLTAVKQSNCVN